MSCRFQLGMVGRGWAFCTRSSPFALPRLRIERHVEAGEQRGLTASAAQAGTRQVLYHPARPTGDGRTVLALSPLEFLAALSRLIPPPHVNHDRYHGVLARLRERVINLGREDAERPAARVSLADGEPRDAGTDGRAAGERRRARGEAAGARPEGVRRASSRDEGEVGRVHGRSSYGDGTAAERRHRVLR